MSSSLHRPQRTLGLVTVLGTLSSLPLSNAYTWTFSSAPAQCSDVTINISGEGGKPPYRVLIIPFGASPLPNNVEARKIFEQAFDGDKKTVTFKMSYPGNSQFVAVVSDATGFGSGGTSVAAQVATSNDASCFDSSKSVSPLFFYNIEPQNQIVQCQNTRIWWDPATVTGQTVFQGVIPGGQSFAIPQGSTTQVPSQGTGFDWKPSLRAGTTLMLVGGDGRGNGTAGSFYNVVSAGVNPDSSCINANSPSSTPGTPAGGSYPTDPSGGGTGGGGGGKSNVGAIVGGIVGGIGVFVLGLLALWFYKRKHKKARQLKERPDLLNADDDDDDEGAGRRGGARPNELPQYYQPEPFLVPDPTVGGRSSHDGTVLSGSNDESRPLSSGTFGESFYTRATTPDVASSHHGDHLTVGGSSANGGRRKGGAPRPMRPVNIIQHDDAGPSGGAPAAGEEPETIELPPAYTALNRSGVAATEDGPQTTTEKDRGRREGERGAVGGTAGAGSSSGPGAAGSSAAA